MSYTKSLSLLIPNNRRTNGNNFMVAIGRGPNTFSVDLSPGGAPVATHWGCHTYDDALGDIVASGTLPTGIIWANFGLTQTTAQQALSAMTAHSAANRSSVTNFDGHATGAGVSRIPHPPA